MRMRGDLVQPFQLRGTWHLLGFCLVSITALSLFPSGDASRASKSHLSLFSHATGRARLLLASLVGTCCFIVAKISVLASML